MRTKSKFSELYEGLQVLADTSFPRKCVTCGRIFKDLTQFIAETEDLRNSTGLQESLDEEENCVVELYRNCPCGSTLMEFLDDRRDTTEAGLKRRERFGALLEVLTAEFDIDSDRARMELLKFLRGQKSPLLSKLGINAE